MSFKSLLAKLSAANAAKKAPTKKKREFTGFHSGKLVTNYVVGGELVVASGHPLRYSKKKARSRGPKMASQGLRLENEKLKKELQETRAEVKRLKRTISVLLHEADRQRVPKPTKPSKNIKAASARFIQDVKELSNRKPSSNKPSRIMRSTPSLRES